MGFSKIFWLEDYPDLLSKLASRFSLNLEMILEKTTFAHDFETGREITGHKEFDLYILDGDFPNRISEEHLKGVEEYLQRIKRGIWNKDDFIQGLSDMGLNNFSRFYTQCLANTPGKKVVFSASTFAPALAYHLGLPFYAKGSMPEEGVREMVADHLSNDADRTK
ncbi:unnamed protein product, partial [marine sediment metagenome]